jgi:hypothetical protein
MCGSTKSDSTNSVLLKMLEETAIETVDFEHYNI